MFHCWPSAAGSPRQRMWLQSLAPCQNSTTSAATAYTRQPASTCWGWACRYALASTRRCCSCSGWLNTSLCSEAMADAGEASGRSRKSSAHSCGVAGMPAASKSGYGAWSSGVCLSCSLMASEWLKSKHQGAGRVCTASNPIAACPIAPTWHALADSPAVQQRTQASIRPWVEGQRRVLPGCPSCCQRAEFCVSPACPPPQSSRPPRRPCRPRATPQMSPPPSA